jgi:D-lactate dehydrogenase
MIKHLRSEQMKEWKSASGAAMWVANNFSPLSSLVPPLLNTVDVLHRVMGPTPLTVISSWLNKVTDHYVPVWNPYMPRGASKVKGTERCE